MTQGTAKSHEQEAAEASVEAFEDDLGPFVVAAETTRMPMVFTDAKAEGHPIIFANDSFLALTRYDRDELLAREFDFLLASDAGEEARAEIAAAFAGREGEPALRFRRKQGAAFWATIFVNPVRDDDGAIVQHFVSLVDETRHREKQARCEMLIDELNHRVKNTLSTVQSIVSQAVRRQSDPDIVRESIESRLFALSRSHDLLTHVNWEGAGLHDLIDVALEPFRVAAGRTERFIVTGEDVRLTPKATLALGIAVHELATNAVKYGAFSNEAGSVRIDWSRAPSPRGERLIVHWQEADGPPVVTPTRKGFGSQVIERGLAHELGGTVHLDYRADGVACTIDIPAPLGLVDG